MTRSHDELRELLAKVLAAMKVSVRDEVTRLHAELDRRLRAQMEAEERFVFPVFARVDVDEACALLREHGQLREQLLLLGVVVDLRCVRYDGARELTELLAHHAEREEKLLYRWAEKRIAPDTLERITRHIAFADDHG